MKRTAFMQGNEMPTIMSRSFQSPLRPNRGAAFATELLHLAASALLLSSSPAAAEEDGATDYVPPQFVPNEVVSFFSSIPRIGGARDFSTIATEDGAKDYVVSISLLAVIILSVALLWLLLISLFKVLGPDRLCRCGAEIGLAGNSIQKPDLVALHANHPLSRISTGQYGDEDQSDGQGGGGGSSETASQIANAQEQEYWADWVTAIERRVRRMRIAALLAGTALVASSVLLIVFGLNGLGGAVDAVRSSADRLSDAFAAGSEMARRIADRAGEASALRDGLLSGELDGLCPGCDASGSATLSDGTVVPVASVVGPLSSGLLGLGDLLLSRATDLTSGLLQVSATLSDVSEDAERYFGWLYYASLSFVIVLDCVSIVFMTGTVMAWRETSPEKFQSAQTYVLMPFFVLCMILMAMSTSAFSIAAVMSSDFCTGAADTVTTSVQKLLDQAKQDPSSPFYQSFVFLSESCASESPINFLETFVPNVESAISAGDAFQQQLQPHSSSDLSDALGIPPEALASALASSQSLTDRLAEMSYSIRNLTDELRCGNVLPPYYAATFGEGLCSRGTTALTWTFACLALVTMMGMTVVTLRASWRDVHDFVMPRDEKRQRRYPDDEYSFDEEEDDTSSTSTYDEYNNDDNRRVYEAGLRNDEAAVAVRMQRPQPPPDDIPQAPEHYDGHSLVSFPEPADKMVAAGAGTTSSGVPTAPQGAGGAPVAHSFSSLTHSTHFRFDQE